MKNFLAQSISVLFQPLIMPSYLFLVLLLFAQTGLPDWTSQTSMLVLAIVFLTTFIVPVLSLLALKYTGSIRGDFFMGERRERVLPFVFISLYYGLTAYLFSTKLVFISPLLVAGIQTLAILIAVLTIITFFWKISAHAMAMGGTLGMLIAVQLEISLVKLVWPIMICAALSGLVMTSRLYLKAHEPAEVWVGFFTGLGLCYFGINILN